MTHAAALLSLIASATASPAIGTWVAERPVLGQPAAGWVELVSRGSSPEIGFKGERFRATRHPSLRGWWVADLPDGRVEVSPDGPHAFWIQSSSNAGQPYATPLRFEAIEAGHHRAWLRPFVEALPLTIHISRANDGTLEALARDRERNGGLYLGLTRAEVDGNRIVFQTRREGQTVNARLVDGGDRMVLTLPFREAPLVLRRAAKGERGMRSRAEGSAVGLRRPLSGGGWEGASPTAAGMAVAPLEGLVRELASAEPTSMFDPMVHALLVARGGTLVVEEYFFGYGPDDPHDSRSAGKSVGSMLAGAVAHDRGQPAAKLLERSICGFDRAYRRECSSDRRTARITLRHALSMSTGLACDDNDNDSPGNEGIMQDQSEEPDWYRYILSVPMIHAPGKKAAYCSAGINLSGIAIRGEGKSTIPELFDRLLARPLGIEHYHMNLAPNGRGYLGGGIRLRPRDMLKLGELMRLGGTWDGTRLLGEDWIAESTRVQASVNVDDDYGLGWWRKSYDVGGRSIDTFYASGNGGQLLFVVPSLDLVVLFQGGNYGNFGTWRRFIEDYLPRILDAAHEPAG